jgi:Fur family peroxide stress response transcriptional regulator
MVNTVESQREKFQALLENHGLRNTSQRRDIHEYLIQTSSHPTARQIFDHLKPSHPTLSLATVYNTLDLLVGAGLISALGEIGDNQVHFDGDTTAHINLACTECLKIVDLPNQKAESINSLVEKSGFAIHGSRVVYYGICPECQLKNNQKIKGDLH